MSKCHSGRKKGSHQTLPAEGIGRIPATRGHGKVSVTVPGAIEYILVTSGVEGREEEGGKGMCRVRGRKQLTKRKLKYASE